ncbi:Transposase IS481 family protein [Methylorubrum aminovorans]
MNIHQNARLTPSGRERLVRLAQSWLSPKAVAETMGVCPKTVGKWVARFETEGAAGLQDRSSRPHTLQRPTPAETQDAIVALRRQRLTGAQIARDLAISPATVSRVLRRHGLSRIRDLDPPVPVQRYERDKPGELIHIDIKKLGRFDRVGHRITGNRIGQSSSRGIGWEYCTWPSTTIRGWPIPRSTPTSSAAPASPSSSTRCASSAATASGSSA